MTFRNRVSRFIKRNEGAVIVEFALVITLFLFIFFAMLDFGRLMYQTTLSEKATYIAARTAIVRPAACSNVPERHVLGTVPTGQTIPRFGTSCRSNASACQAVAPISCNGIATNATANEIWTRIEPMLPPDATIDNLQFTYRFDPNLGFLGGPYTPMVTVALNLPDFDFVSALSLLSAAIADGGDSLGASAGFADFSVTLPSEDLNSGENG